MKRKYQKETRMINELEQALTEAMDKVCTKHNYKVEYNLINIAFANVIRNNLYHEMKMKNKEDEN